MVQGIYNKKSGNSKEKKQIEVIVRIAVRAILFFEKNVKYITKIQRVYSKDTEEKRKMEFCV